MSGSPGAAWRLSLLDPAATAALGRLLGATAPDRALLLLAGPLGAGKTTLAQGVGAGCGVSGPIASPTFTLVAHHAGARPFTHVDLFRLAGPADLATLDLDEILDRPGVTCVEWPELLGAEIRVPAARLRLAYAEGGREATGRFAGAGWEAAQEALCRAGAAAA